MSDTPDSTEPRDPITTCNLAVEPIEDAHPAPVAMEAERLAWRPPGLSVEDARRAVEVAVAARRRI
jgi:hypothetical protein